MSHVRRAIQFAPITQGRHCDPDVPANMLSDDSSSKKIQKTDPLTTSPVVQAPSTVPTTLRPVPRPRSCQKKMPLHLHKHRTAIRPKFPCLLGLLDRRFRILRHKSSRDSTPADKDGVYGDENPEHVEENEVQPHVDKVAAVQPLISGQPFRAECHESCFK